LFREFDKDKKGTDRANLVKIMARLAEDECIIGKIPFVSPDKYDQLFIEWPDKVTWEYFREHVN
jgi:hypothetical protein